MCVDFQCGLKVDLAVCLKATLTGSVGLVIAHVMIVDSRMNIFGDPKCSISECRAMINTGLIRSMID